MECISAQELLSAAHDGETVAVEPLDAARAHCADCAECTAFVALLETLDDAPGATLPHDFVPAIMREIEAAIQDEGLARTAQLASGAESGPQQTGAWPASAADADAGPAKTWSELLARAFSERNRTEVVAWIAAAVVVFIAAGVGGIAGMRTILVPPPPPADTIVVSGAPESSTDAARDMQAGTLAAETKDAGPEAGAGLGASSADAQFIVLEGTVYRLAGELTSENADQELAAAQPAGSVSTALDSGIEHSYPVRRTPDGAMAYLSSATKRLKFERVVRSFNGRMYVLRSEPIEGYGNWPGWPSGTPQPVGDDGGSDFTPLGTDDLGARVYAPAGADGASGIAVAPSSAAGDPVAGSGVWTWWEPAPTR